MSMYVVVAQDPYEPPTAHMESVQVFRQQSDAIALAKVLAEETKHDWYVCSCTPVALYKGKP